MGGAFIHGTGLSFAGQMLRPQGIQHDRKTVLPENDFPPTPSGKIICPFWAF
jgi:hypothetical protein